MSQTPTHVKYQRTTESLISTSLGFFIISSIKNIHLKFCSQLQRSPGIKNIPFLVVLPSFSKVTAPRCIPSSLFFTFTCFVFRTGTVSHWFKRIRFEFGHCHGLMDKIKNSGHTQILEGKHTRIAS